MQVSASPQMHFGQSNSEYRSNPCSPSAPKPHPQHIALLGCSSSPQHQAQKRILACYYHLLLLFSGSAAQKGPSLHPSQTCNRSISLGHATSPAPAPHPLLRHPCSFPSLPSSFSSFSSQLIAWVSCLTEGRSTNPSSHRAAVRSSQPHLLTLRSRL